MASASRVAATAGGMAFLYQFENCMTATALPVMSREIPGLSGVVSLVPAAYLVAATVAMVPAGRLAVRIGFERMLAFALGIMAIGALLCSMAPHAVVLIAGRWVEGLGGGAMASTAYGMIAACVPSERRRGALGLVSLGAGIGMMAGTPLGGSVAQLVSWRALFAFQVLLLGLVALVVARMHFGKGNNPRPMPLGLARSLVVGIGITSACVAGTLGRERGWLSSEILAMQFAALLLLVGFAYSERRAVSPLFARAVWLAKRFWPCWGLLLACSAAMGGTFFLLPFYLHEAVGLSVPAAAAWMMVEVAAYSLSAAMAGRLQRILTVERQALVGTFLALAGVLLFDTGTVVAWGTAGVAVGCLLVGCGFGLVFPAVNAGCVERLPEDLRGQNASLLPLGLNLGMVVGVVVSGELREWKLGESHSLDYAYAFSGIVLALGVSAVGFWMLGRTRTLKNP